MEKSTWRGEEAFILYTHNVSNVGGHWGLDIRVVKDLILLWPDGIFEVLVLGLMHLRKAFVTVTFKKVFAGLLGHGSFVQVDSIKPTWGHLFHKFFLQIRHSDCFI